MYACERGCAGVCLIEQSNMLIYDLLHVPKVPLDVPVCIRCIVRPSVRLFTRPRKGQTL